jgi:hypothetical protein
MKSMTCLMSVDILVQPLQKVGVDFLEDSLFPGFYPGSTMFYTSTQLGVHVCLMANVPAILAG